MPADINTMAHRMPPAPTDISPTPADVGAPDSVNIIAWMSFDLFLVKAWPAHIPRPLAQTFRLYSDTLITTPSVFTLNPRGPD